MKVKEQARTRKLLRKSLLSALAALLLSLILLPAAGQRRSGGQSITSQQQQEQILRRRSGLMRHDPDTDEPEARPEKPSGEFTFIRTIYDSRYSPYGGRSTWWIDYPNADHHIVEGLQDWTGTILNVSQVPEQVPIMDDHLFDFPMIYFVEPGFMELSDEQAARIREYVERGGFLFFDDFWGVREWNNLTTQLQKVDPEFEIKDLPMDDPILHSYLDIDQVVQVPNIYNAMRGQTSEKGGIVPHWMSIKNKRGHTVGFISHNCDLGDAWEWIDDPRYPVKYGLPAYKIAINVVIYAMSH